MKKQINFSNSGNTRLDDKIRETLDREFALPEKVETAKDEAFAQIRKTQESPLGKNGTTHNAQKEKPQKARKTLWRTCAATAAAAAVFSGACITHPAFAAQVPLVGHVFEEIGASLGFSGDYSEYAEALEEPEDAVKEAEGAAKEAESAVKEPEGAAKEAESAEKEAEGAIKETDPAEEGAGQTSEEMSDSDDGTKTDEGAGDTLYSETRNGMTVTLSEVYCNDAALYVSMVLKTEDKFPDTKVSASDESPVIDILQSKIKFSYNDQKLPVSEYLDGKMIDEHTFAGVMRYDLSDSMDTADDGSKTEAPDSFSVTLTIPQVVGYKAEPEEMPEIPEDLRAEYEAAMAENGLGLTDEDYAGFTEEQQEIEYKLYHEMMNAYAERYPNSFGHPNRYEHWWVDGPWKFTFDVTRNSSGTVVKEINDVNKNGLGLVSVTKTPFELTVEDGRNDDYATVVLDADGDILPDGSVSGSANVYAIQDRDVSKVDVYICDYLEYMDELKGYYWSEDYEENKKTKTFKELLDERALYHREITFDE